MGAAGLVISAADPTDGSAYSHRLRELAKGLNQWAISCDFFFMPEHRPLRKVTTSSLLLPLWLPTLRKYDFIHCGDEEATQAIVLCRPLLRGKIVYDMHGDVVAQSALRNEVNSSGRRRSASLRVKLFERMALAAADHVLCVSSLQRSSVISRGISPENVSLIRNGVDLELFQQLPQPRRPRFTFAYVGDFQVWQGIPNLIAAFAQIKNPAVRLLVVGFNEADRPIKRVFEEKFGPRVELVDRTSRQTLVQLLGEAAILVIPRIRHNAVKHAFPTKFAEYAALGRPILVNDVDETADFVRRYRCGFVSGTSADALTETMEAAASQSPEVLAAMGNRARLMAQEHFSWDIICREYARLIRRLTGS